MTVEPCDLLYELCWMPQLLQLLSQRAPVHSFAGVGQDCASYSDSPQIDCEAELHGYGPLGQIVGGEAQVAGYCLLLC